MHIVRSFRQILPSEVIIVERDYIHFFQLNDAEDELKRASKKGAREDIIHVSPVDDGYDLRIADHFQTSEKQQKD